MKLNIIISDFTYMKENYCIAGWSPAVVAACGDATYTAEYRATINTYTVTFVYGDGKLHTVKVAHGQAAIPPTDTHKTATESTVYTFDGWDHPFDAVTTDLVVTARYIESDVVTRPVTDATVPSGGQHRENDSPIPRIILHIVTIAAVTVILIHRTRPPSGQPRVRRHPCSASRSADAVSTTAQGRAIPILVKEVSAEDVDGLMSDALAVELLEETQERGGTGKLRGINIGVICTCFAENDVVTPNSLKAKGLIPADVGRVKILASGRISKPLTVKADAFSIQAIKMITLTGGRAVKLSGKDK